MDRQLSLIQCSAEALFQSICFSAWCFDTSDKTMPGNACKCARENCCLAVSVHFSIKELDKHWTADHSWDKERHQKGTSNAARALDIRDSQHKLLCARVSLTWASPSSITWMLGNLSINKEEWMQLQRSPTLLHTPLQSHLSPFLALFPGSPPLLRNTSHPGPCSLFWDPYWSSETKPHPHFSVWSPAVRGHNIMAISQDVGQQHRVLQSHPLHPQPVNKTAYTDCNSTSLR